MASWLRWHLTPNPKPCTLNPRRVMIKCSSAQERDVEKLKMEKDQMNQDILESERQVGSLTKFGSVWPLVSWEGRKGKEHGNYCNGLYRDYFKDPFLHS